MTSHKDIARAAITEIELARSDIKDCPTHKGGALKDYEHLDPHLDQAIRLLKGI